ncbi:MAG: hypothetical protein R8K47_00425, partial [Mariprofundaceae bacterium]
IQENRSVLQRVQAFEGFDILGNQVGRLGLSMIRGDFSMAMDSTPQVNCSSMASSTTLPMVGFGVGHKMRPADFPGHPEDIDSPVSIRVLRIGALDPPRPRSLPAQGKA